MNSIRLYLSCKPENTYNILRQTPEGKGIWNGHQFYINDGHEPSDTLVVFANSSKIIRTTVPKERRIFIAGEPPEMKFYPDRFLAQFGTIISSHETINHPNAYLKQQGYPWFSGIRFEDNKKQVITRIYDDYKNEAPIKKTKRISVVCSDKSSKPGHKKRFEFVTKLKEALGDEVDLYGTGQNPIANKSDAIRPYQYHIAIENSSAPHYWSEKLADCYLDEAYPFYAGCPEIGEYFPENAFTLINLDNIEGSIKKIRQAIKEDRHLQMLSSIRESKRRVLEEYNIFNVIVQHIEQLEATVPVATKTKHKIYPRKWFHKGLRTRLQMIISDFRSQRFRC
jgi:hypothetical protein